MYSVAVARIRRQSNGAIAPGSVQWFYGTGANDYLEWPGHGYSPASTKETHDISGGVHTDNPFYSIKTSVSASPISGMTGRYAYENVGPAVCSDFVPLPYARTDSQLFIEAFNRSNPSRPVVDIGVTIAELRDAPSLLNIAAKTLARKGANALLAYQFGWKPLLSDIKKLVDFQVDTARRVDELNRLYSSGGLKRRIQLGTEQSSKRIIRHPVSSQGKYLTVDGHANSVRKSWATMRFVPQPGTIPPATDKAKLMLAIRATYGLTVDISTAWELLPWSWMIDWFSNVGDYLQTTRNIVGADLASSCIMVHTRQSCTMEAVSEPGLTGGDHSYVIETKHRSVNPMAIPEIDLGFGINPYRASILGALAVNRVPVSAYYVPTNPRVNIPRRK